MRRTADNTTENQLRIAIIGSGAAGLACAMTALERGARVTLIEHRSLGGASLNTSGIAANTLYRAAQIASIRSTSPFDAAISAAKPSIRPDALLDLRHNLTEDMRERQLETLRRFPHLKLMEGEARFLDKDKLIVRLNDDSRKLSFRKVPFDRCLIASGAIANLPQISGLGGTPYWTSTEALACPTIPPRLAVLGSSAAALELAQAFARLGSQVTILASDSMLFCEDPEVDMAIMGAFQAEGITIQNSAQASEVSYENGEFVLVTNRGEARAERMLVATGRMPNTHNLCLDMLGAEFGVGVKIDVEGHVPVDDHQRTSMPGIYAAGACADMPGFTHVAAAAGTCAAINMTGGNAALDLTIMPSVVFTDPQVATVGLSEPEARSQGIESVSRMLPLTRVPRALVNFDTRGFIKMVAEADSLRLLGVQAVAPEAGELIQTATIAMRARMTVQDLADQLFPYLTMVEGLKLCARLFSKDVK